MKKLTIPALACAMTLGFGLASAQTITPTRVGPVSQYGKLITGKNSQNQGRIYGSCEGVKDGAEVQVRGMSLYWSLVPQALEYWTEEGINNMVKDMKIQLVRAAMSTKEAWNNTLDDGTKLVGYDANPDLQTKFMRTVVEAAIKQDIYVIIDWHSHQAENQTEMSKKFFTEMSKDYGNYDNVIFEVYNEPIGEWGQDAAKNYWPTIKNYATEVISSIRQNSQNLVLVGTPYYDQYPNAVINSPISAENVAYTFHYYAMSHCTTGSQGWGDGTNDACEGQNALNAMNAGHSIFISEWGTGTADGKGTPGQSENQKWQEYVNKYKLSWANWSASHVDEGTAAFSGGSNKNNLQYRESGTMVKGFLSTNPETYTKCATGTQGGEQGGSTPEIDAITRFIPAQSFNVSFVNNALEINGAEAANVELFDLKGNKLMMIDGVAGSLSLAALPAGMYMVKVTSGSTSKIQAINLK